MVGVFDTHTTWERVRSVICKEGFPDRVVHWRWCSDDEGDGLPRDPAAAMREIEARVKEYHVHSFLYNQNQRKQQVARRSADADLELRRPPRFSYSSAGAVGKIQLYTFSSWGLSESESRASERALTDLINNQLDDWEREGLSGLILDFRNHHGGSFWPLLYAFERYLANRPLFAWVTDETEMRGKKAAIWATRTRGGQYFQESVYSAKKQQVRMKLPIALILGERTSSSGEIAAAMFQGKPGVRSFGKPTSGDCTVNQEFDVGRGMKLVLTVKRLALSDGTYLKEERLVPDQESRTPVGDAREWIRQAAAGKAQTTRAGRDGRGPGRRRAVLAEAR